MDELTRIFGILGAYFAILLVLAISIETILEPITCFKVLRSKVSPDEVMKDIQTWIPKHPKLTATTSASALAHLTREYSIAIVDVVNKAEAIKTIADETAKGLGITTQLDFLEIRLVVCMSELRNKYQIDEKTRIIILRSIAAVIGIIIAVVLKIDTFKILAGLFTQDYQAMLTTSIGHYSGMVISGLAASAGSSFWHDQLGRMRAVKEAAHQLNALSK